MYAKITSTEIIYPYSIEQLKCDYSNTSFPDIISDDILTQFNIVKVSIKSRPDIDYTQNLIPKPLIKINNEWIQDWSIEPATPEEIDQRILQQTTEVNNLRDSLLYESDWTQLPDSLLTDENKEKWRSYRAQLRNLSLQPRFPFDITYPNKPDVEYRIITPGVAIPTIE